MITALVSAVMGLVSSMAPDIMKYVQDRADKAHELAVMQLQIEQAKAVEATKLEEVKVQADSASDVAFIEQVKAIVQAQAQPSGVKWIDGFNALMRPLAVAMIMTIFGVSAICLSLGALTMYFHGDIGMLTAANEIYGSLVGDAIQAVLGFLFGAREYRKAK